MQKTLDKLVIKLCENLPLEFTFFEKDGFCRKPNDDCVYCKKSEDNLYFCNKNTYILNQKIKFT